MDVYHPSDSGCVVSFSFMACSGHHISLRLLSLHSCNEYLSLPKTKKKKKKSKRFASPYMGIICSGLNAYCMQPRPLFLRTSGSSGVPKALLLEGNGQLSCNPTKNKKKKCMQVGQHHAAQHLSHSNLQWLALCKLPRALRGSARQPTVSLAICYSSPTSCKPPQTPVSARCHKGNHHARWSASTCQPPAC